MDTSPQSFDPRAAPGGRASQSPIGGVEGFLGFDFSSGGTEAEIQQRNKQNALAGGNVAIRAFKGVMAGLAADAYNEFLSDSMDRARTGTMMSEAQASASAGVELQKRARVGDRIAGRIRVAFGDSPGASNRSIENQNLFDTELDQQIIRTNYANQLRTGRMQYRNQIDSLASQGRNPVLEGFLAALS